VAILLSVPASAILLALAIAVLLLSGLPLQWPRIAIPLGAFLIWTLLSLAFSPDPAAGRPQVNKIFVFVTMLTVFSSVRSIREAWPLMLAWIGVGTMSAAVGFLQFAKKWNEAHRLHRDFYHFYLDSRATGFQSHWMTFSGQLLYVLLLLVAFGLFGSSARKTVWIWLPCILAIGAAIALSFTRGVWIAAILACSFLIWGWNRRAVWAVPILLIVTFVAGPASLRERVYSLVHPEEKTDSNKHRWIVWQTGWEMVKAHPIFGVGPEEIAKDEVFLAYLPKDIPQPLPPGDYKHLHSIYVHYAAERGIPAALLLTGALLMAFLDFRRALKSLPPGRSDRRFVLQWAGAAVIGTMIVGVSDLNLGLTPELTMFLVIVSLGYRAAITPEEPVPVIVTPA